MALAPAQLFSRELDARQLVQPFAIAADVGAYWLTSLKARALSPSMAAFSAWCQAPEFRAPL